MCGEEDRTQHTEQRRHNTNRKEFLGSENNLKSTHAQQRILQIRVIGYSANRMKSDTRYSTLNEISTVRTYYVQMIYTRTFTEKGLYAISCADEYRKD